MFPPPNNWWTSPLNAISNFLFPPLPSGTPSTAGYGVQGGSYGMAPMSVINVPSMNTTAGISTPTPAAASPTTMTTSPLSLGGPVKPGLHTQYQTPVTMPGGYFASPLSAPPPPIYGQPAPGAVRTPLGGTESGGMGTISQPPPIAPAGQESDSAFRAGNQAATVIQQPTGTNTYGNASPTWVSGNQAATDGVTDQQMIDAGYVKDANGNWVLSGSTAGNVTGTTPPASTANAYWRTSGSNFGQTGWQGQVHGQRFGSEQAYTTWLNRQKRGSKKEEDEQLRKAQATVTASIGTG